MKGQTLLLNLYHPPEEVLTEDSVVKLFLRRLVEAAGMTPLEHTWSVEHFPVPVGGEFKGGYGLSANLILVESHIYIHTWPECRYARIELSSCKPIDADSVLRTVEAFCGKSSKVEHQLIDWEM